MTTCTPWRARFPGRPHLPAAALPLRPSRGEALGERGELRALRGTVEPAGAREFVAWLDLAPGLHWLDVGCGTGALTEAVLAAGAPTRVMGVDASSGFVGYATAHVTDPRASFGTGTRVPSPPRTPPSTPSCRVFC